MLAIPVAAGVLYPSLGILMRPEWAALLMSAPTVIVMLYALTINRFRFAPVARLSPISARAAMRE